MHNKYISFFLSLIQVFLYACVFAQLPVKDAKKQMGSPVKYAFTLAGSFGELRNTHFHAGIDIRPSSEKEGDGIFSVADGHIHRIRVQPGGFGKAIYIIHPSIGYTTVYAHLDSFNESLEDYVTKVQKSRQSYAVNIDLPSELFKVKRGDYLGVMGNTGQSYGTHLHFEIRETKTEKPVNPFLFSLKPPDNIPPSLLNVAVHGLDGDFQKTEQMIIPVNEGGQKKKQLPVVLMTSNYIGIAAECFDRMNGAPNKNGIYKLRLYTEDSLLYSYSMDRVSFGEMNQIAGFIDYPQKQTDNATYALCYKLPEISLGFLKHNASGVVRLSDGAKHYFCLEVEDFEHNITEFEWFVQKLESPVVREDVPFLQRIISGQKWTHNTDYCTVTIHENSLFRNINFRCDTVTDSLCSPCYNIHSHTEPVRNNIEVELRSENFNKTLKNKAIIVRVDPVKGIINHGGTIQKDGVRTSTRFFGRYALRYDTIAPTILPVSFIKKAAGIKRFTFQIKDELEIAGNAKDITYKVFIDDKLVICPYKSMTKILEVPLKEILSGNHTLKIQATDHSGNTAVYKSSFSN